MRQERRTGRVGWSQYFRRTKPEWLDWLSMVDLSFWIVVMLASGGIALFAWMFK